MKISPENEGNKLPKDFQPTPPMLINQISRLFDERMHESGNLIMHKESNRAILRVLRHYESLTQQEIVNKTRLKAPTISISLSNLERDGIITRRSDDDDMRFMHVSLTDAGRALLEETHEKILELENILMNGMSKEEIDTALSILTRMRDNIINSKKI